VAEQGAGQAVVGTAKVRMIKNVEELRAEKKPYVFRDMKLTLHRNIRLRGSETAQDIASEIPLLSFRRRGERRTIEDFPTGILRSKEFKRYSWV
jgi:cyanophycinase-like exopeptidase